MRSKCSDVYCVVGDYGDRPDYGSDTDAVKNLCNNVMGNVVLRFRLLLMSSFWLCWLFGCLCIW